MPRKARLPAGHLRQPKRRPSGGWLLAWRPRALKVCGPSRRGFFNSSGWTVCDYDRLFVGIEFAVELFGTAVFGVAEADIRVTLHQVVHVGTHVGFIVENQVAGDVRVICEIFADFIASGFGVVLQAKEGSAVQDFDAFAEACLDEEDSVVVVVYPHGWKSWCSS